MTKTKNETAEVTRLRKRVVKIAADLDAIDKQKSRLVDERARLTRSLRAAGVPIVAIAEDAGVSRQALEKSLRG